MSITPYDGLNSRRKIVLFFIVCLFIFLFFAPVYSFQSHSEETRAEFFFHTYEEMASEIDDIVKHNSQIMVVNNLTTTFEGRTVWAVKISDSPQINDSTEPDVLFMAGLSANSAISVEIAMYLLNYIGDNYGIHDDITRFVNTREIWILPMVNPDGHEFAINDNPNWTKNRRDLTGGYFGVNLERNFGYEWGEGDNSSDDPASHNYHGGEAFSEPESQAVRDLVNSQNFVFSLSFSSSGEIITYPFGYNDTQAMKFDILSEIARDLSLYNGYASQQESTFIKSRGNPNDWLYGEKNILPFYVYAGEDDDIREDQIEAIAKENLPGCLYLLDIAEDPNKAFLAKWTFMVYMGGDNNLEDEGILDINEMEKQGSNPYVNIVVQFDRAAGYDDTNGNWQDTRRFHVLRDYDDKIINSPLKGILGETNMADPQTLLDFVNWSISNYPAQQYFLDLWGHGKGWQGVTLDGSDWLTMDEIRSVLSKFSDRIDVVGFDNCNMAMIEVYTTFLGYADYIVGSEKEEDALGWPYDRIFEDLRGDPSMSPLDLSKIIASHYVDWAENNSYYSASISVTDMAHLWDMINRTDVLARILNRTLGLYYDDIDDSVKKTEVYAKPPNPRDLYHFAELLESNVNNTPIKIAASAVMDGFKELILANEYWTSPTDSVKVDHAHGITIWLYDGTISTYQDYQQLDFAKLSFWDEFLAAYKSGSARPHVTLNTTYQLGDSDLDGNHDAITIECSTNVSGLNIQLEIFNGANSHIGTLYWNDTLENETHPFMFTPKDVFESDYYSFFIYLENETNIPQNYSEVTNIWLGNEKPDVVIKNVTIHRVGGQQIGQSTGKSAIDGESTLIKAVVSNEGNSVLTGVIVGFYEGENLISEVSVNLSIGEEITLYESWVAAQGRRTIKAIADKTNTLKEINETNNEMTESIAVISNIPVDSLILRGKVLNKDKINIIGASVRITNLRTNETINKTTDENGYKVKLDPDWFLEGDEMGIKARYNEVSHNVTVTAHSEEGTIWANITLKTELYDGLFYFKVTLIIIEIIGFILVINYYIRSRRAKLKE